MTRNLWVVQVWASKAAVFRKREKRKRKGSLQFQLHNPDDKFWSELQKKIFNRCFIKTWLTAWLCLQLFCSFWAWHRTAAAGLRSAHPLRVLFLTHLPSRSHFLFFSPRFLLMSAKGVMVLPWLLPQLNTGELLPQADGRCLLGTRCSHGTKRKPQN